MRRGARRSSSAARDGGAKLGESRADPASALVTQRPAAGAASQRADQSGTRIIDHMVVATAGADQGSIGASLPITISATCGKIKVRTNYSYHSLVELCAKSRGREQRPILEKGSPRFSTRSCVALGQVTTPRGVLSHAATPRRVLSYPQRRAGFGAAPRAAPALCPAPNPHGRWARPNPAHGGAHT